jgi:ribonucleoside-diphosphate reductase beta chain
MRTRGAWRGKLIMFTRYDTFVILAETLQWDEAAIDFTPDKAAWPALGGAENARVLGLIAGFCIAEWAVSGHLGSFQAAASDELVAACFRAQARDEHRHARFFDRVAAEVAAVPGADMAARLDVLRTLVSPDLVALFEERLPATAMRLAEDREGLAAAVGLYHMVLEGVVLLAGQNALLDTLDHLSAALPGVRRGVELVLRDERWHIGFGTRLVQGSGLGHDEVEAIVALGQASAGAWGDLVSPEAAARAANMHRNRLRAVGRKFF